MITSSAQRLQQLWFLQRCAITAPLARMSVRAAATRCRRICQNPGKCRRTWCSGIKRKKRGVDVHVARAFIQLRQFFAISSALSGQLIETLDASRTTAWTPIVANQPIIDLSVLASSSSICHNGCTRQPCCSGAQEGHVMQLVTLKCRFMYPQVTPSHVVIVLTNRTLTTKLASAVGVNKGCKRTPLSGCDTAFLLYSETYFSFNVLPRILNLM
jgi:hypothetical protein